MTDPVVRTLAICAALAASTTANAGDPPPTRRPLEDDSPWCGTARFPRVPLKPLPVVKPSILPAAPKHAVEDVTSKPAIGRSLRVHVIRWMHRGHDCLATVPKGGVDVSMTFVNGRPIGAQVTGATAKQRRCLSSTLRKAASLKKHDGVVLVSFRVTARVR
jgi:hypothetical protein